MVNNGLVLISRRSGIPVFTSRVIQVDSILDSRVCGNVVLVSYFGLSGVVVLLSETCLQAVLNGMFKLTPPSVLLQGMIVSWDLHPPYARSPAIPPHIACRDTNQIEWEAHYHPTSQGGSAQLL